MAGSKFCDNTFNVLIQVSIYFKTISVFFH